MGKQESSTRVSIHLAKVPWTIVRGFGSVKYFNISYGVLLIIPIMHELYVRSVPLMQLFGAPGPFPITLKWAYAASLCFALGLLIYQLRCPPEIRRFGVAGDFVKDQYDIFLRAHPQRRLEIVLAQLNPEIDKDVLAQIEILVKIKEDHSAQASQRIEAQYQLEKLVLAQHGDAVQKHLMTCYDDLNLSRWKARFGSFGFFVTGSAIVLGLLVERSFRVLAG